MNTIDRLFNLHRDSGDLYKITNKSTSGFTKDLNDLNTSNKE
jgi:hypothetical protein